MADNVMPGASSNDASSGPFPSTARTADASGKIDRAARAAHDKVDQLADKAEPARERLHESVDSAATAVKTQVDRLDRLQDAWLTGARECVRANPLASIVAAVAVGMLFERVVRRR